MAKLTLKNFRLDFPEGFDREFSDADFVEWFEFETGLTSTLSKSNPLNGVEIKDCKVKIGEATLDGKIIRL